MNKEIVLDTIGVLKGVTGLAVLDRQVQTSALLQGRPSLQGVLHGVLQIDKQSPCQGAVVCLGQTRVTLGAQWFCVSG